MEESPHSEQEVTQIYSFCVDRLKITYPDIFPETLGRLANEGAGIILEKVRPILLNTSTAIFHLVISPTYQHGAYARVVEKRGFVNGIIGNEFGIICGVLAHFFVCRSICKGVRNLNKTERTLRKLLGFAVNPVDENKVVRFVTSPTNITEVYIRVFGPGKVPSNYVNEVVYPTGCYLFAQQVERAQRKKED